MPRSTCSRGASRSGKRKRQIHPLDGRGVATAALRHAVGRWHIGRVDRAPERAKPAAGRRDCRARQADQGDRRARRTRKRRLLARMEIIETLQRSRPEIVHILDEIVRIPPRGVYLTYAEARAERAFRAARRRAVQHACVRLHAQHRQLGVARRPRPAHRGDQGSRRRARADFTLFANQRSRVTPSRRRKARRVASK